MEVLQQKMALVIVAVTQEFVHLNSIKVDPLRKGPITRLGLTVLIGPFTKQLGKLYTQLHGQGLFSQFIREGGGHDRINFVVCYCWI